MGISEKRILIDRCTDGIYLRWWYNGWHYFNFQDNYEIMMNTENEGIQTTRFFSRISKVERPSRVGAEYSYQVTLQGISTGDIPGFTGLILAERVEQYENETWYEVEITRGDHVEMQTDAPGYEISFEVTRKDRSMTSTVARNIVKLYLGDTLCDLDDDEIIPLNRQVNNIAEMQDRQSDFSASFDIRKTREMRALFELSGEVGAPTDFPYREQLCRLVQDGLEIITNGMLILESVNDQYYNVSILSGNKDFFKAIENLKLSDLRLASADHTWNATVQAASHALGGDYLYPLCEPSDDGGICPITDDGAEVKVYGGWMWPFVKVSAIWDEIFSDVDYTCLGDILTDDTFLSLWMPIVNLDISNYSKDDYLYNGSRRGYKEFTDPASILQPLDRIILGDEDFENGEYNTPYAATYSLRTILYNISAAPTHVYIYADGVQVIEMDRNYSFTDYLVYDGDYTATAAETLTIRVTPCTLYEFHVQVLAIADAAIAFGGAITPYLHLPDLTQTEFIKMICNMFGLIPECTSRDHKIRFWHFNDLYDNISDARDWSAYLSERDDTTEFKFGDYAKRNYLRYKDSDDVLENTGRGIMFVEDETLQEKKDVVDSPVSTCDEVTVLTDVATSRINMNIWEDKDTDCYVRNDKIDPRIVYVRQVEDRTLTFREDVTDCVPSDTEHSVEDPLVASSLEVAFSSLIVNYSALSRLLTKTKLRKCKMNLPVYEIVGLHHDIPVYLEQYKAYFYVNKISNYVPGRLCDVELVKL